MRRYFIIIIYCVAGLGLGALYAQQLDTAMGYWMLAGALVCIPFLVSRKPLLSALHASVLLFVSSGAAFLSERYNAVPGGFSRLMADWGKPQADYFEQTGQMDAAILFWGLSVIPVYGTLYALYSMTVQIWEKRHMPASVTNEDVEAGEDTKMKKGKE